MSSVVNINELKEEQHKKWYAVYTHPRAEKRVELRLHEKGIEAWLPLQKTLKQWSDRKKVVEVPLLRSYLFVNISRLEYDNVLKTDGISRFVTFEGKAASIPQNQIDNLKLLINSDTEIEINTINFKPGQKVKVVLGSLQGLVGELVQKGRKKRVLIRILNLDQNLLVKIPPSYLESVH